MSNRDRIDLLLLAAVWGFSFLFMRVAVPEFGTFALVELRVGIASLFLVALLALQGKLARLGENKGRMVLLGAVNSAIPFSLFAFAAYFITAGTAAVLNASAPLFAAVVAYLWLKDRMTPARVAGLAIGFSGVVVLLWDKIAFNGNGTSWALAATLVASLCYGIAANYTKKHFAGTDPTVNAAGSLIGATLLLLPMSIVYWPQTTPSLVSWGSAIGLGVVCTAFAYILYFRLIERAGPTKAIAVTYLVPVFGMLWGGLFLGETVSAGMLIACAVILFGTALTTGTLALRARSLGVSEATRAVCEAGAACLRSGEPVRLANFR
jgi:drug/metabolite transporter (DMT)-like permease